MVTIMDITIITKTTPLMNLKSIISACASLLLLSSVSCNKADDGENDLMYMWFEVSGCVVDAAGVPIQGITVMAESAESVQTDRNGQFTVNGGGVPAETTAVKFVDTDKTGKQYVSQTVMVSLVKYKEGHGWNNGYYKNKEDLTVVMVEESSITPFPGVL